MLCSIVAVFIIALSATRTESGLADSNEFKSGTARSQHVIDAQGQTLAVTALAPPEGVCILLTSPGVLFADQLLSVQARNTALYRPR